MDEKSELWISAEKFGHNFDAEGVFNEFVASQGGQLISSLISKHPNFENADYCFSDEKIIIELKSIQVSFFESREMSNALGRVHQKWLSEDLSSLNEVELEQINLKRNNDVRRILKEPLRRVVKKANSQTRSTKNNMGKQDHAGLLFIVHDVHMDLPPVVIANMLSEILLKEFSNIHGYVYFTINHYVDIGSEYAQQFWVPAYSEHSPDHVVEFVDRLGAKWYEFFGDKIGGWDHPLVQTGDRAFFERAVPISADPDRLRRKK